MIQEDNRFIDLSLITYDNNKKNKCKLPEFLKDVLNILIPITLIIGTIIGISFLIAAI
tara:strand:+ start:1217 stop:1390 length:174 start_codon:yes stop_codon:yes gene_type:complete